MILELMDSRYLKRFLLLDYLHINQNHSIELMELVKLSQVSYPTVKKIITDIRMDIIDLGYSEYVELIDLPEQNKVIWNVKKNFSLMIFRLYYLENSYRFQLFSLFLEPKEWTISEITKKINTTYTMVKKELIYLERFITINANNLHLRTDRRLTLLGDEVTIRLFYTGIFQQVYGGYKWPFVFISTNEIINLLESLDVGIYRKFSARFVSIHYGLAISLLRANKRSIPDNVYYWEPISIQEKKMYDHLFSLLKKKMAMIHPTILKREVKFIISCIIASDLGHHDGSLPVFFNESPKLKEIGFLHMINEKVHMVERFALREMTTKERDKLFARLVGVFYQILIYQEALHQRLIDLYVYHPFDFPANKERERTFYQIFMSKCSRNLNAFEAEYIEYFCVAYYKILFFELDRQLFHPKIRIFIISNRTPEMLVSTKLKTIGDYFYIEIADSLCREVDLILTDIALSNQTKSFLPRKIPILYLTEGYCPSDNKLLQEILPKIADKKYREIKKIGHEKRF